MSQSEVSPAECAVRLHRATGVAILAARQLVVEQPELARRILQAAESQTACFPFHDPLEDDPAHASVVAEAFARAERDIDAKFRTGHFRGRCHAVWQRVEFLLHEEHSLAWFSPARMNPGCCFD